MEEELFFKVETFLEVTLKMINSMVKDNILEIMVNNIKDNGNRIKSMVMEFISGLMVLDMKEIIKMDKENINLELSLRGKI